MECLDIGSDAISRGKFSSFMEHLDQLDQFGVFDE
jgi:hypothetical protein